MTIRGDSNLPEEILVNILYRLPAKSVGRFRCVSKSWRALLSQPEFIETHLHYSKSRQQSLLFLSKKQHSLFSTSLDDDHHLFIEVIMSFTKLNFADHTDSWNRFYGSCDGLVLVSDKKHKMFVLNPITREIRKVPPSPFVNLQPFFNFGLGYDSVSDDYKMVVYYFIRSEQDPSFAVGANVYSLKTGSWTWVESCPQNYITWRLEYGAYVGGCLNWIAYDRNDDLKPVILTFNLVDEKFRELPLPKSFRRDKANWCDVLNGCLCVCNRNENDVWVMSKYGAPESWTKYTIKDDGCKTLSFLNQGQAMMLKFGKYVIYNLKEGAMKNTVVYGISEGVYATQSFTESLISPHGSNETRRN